MCKKINMSVEESTLWENALKTVSYLFDALLEQDYDAAKLELLDLKFSIVRLEDQKQKRERRQQLLDLVVDMQKRGINIDIAKRSSFLKNNAKNAAEIYRNNAEIHKKRQQA